MPTHTFNQASLVAQTVKNLPAMQETWVLSLSLEDPQRREWLPTPVFLPEKFHGQKSLVGHSPLGCKRIGHDLATMQQTTYPLTITH